MTFGRSPNDPFSNGFGPGPATGSRLDDPYRDVADGFGGRGPAADGFGRPPAPLAVGEVPLGPVNDPDGFITRREHDESLDHAAKLVTLEHMLATKFDAMGQAITLTCAALVGPPAKHTSFIAELVNLAASAAIAGAAGVVAEILAQRMAASVMPGFDRFKKGYQRFAGDAIKDQLKKAIHVGVASRFDTHEAALARNFELTQFLKLDEAKGHFHRSFSAQMANVSTEELNSEIVEADVNPHDAEIIDATSKQIAVEWANLIARVHHGAGDWDPWAGEQGARHGGLPTRDAAAPPVYGPPGTARADGEHPSSGNVDPDSESIREITDDAQRPMLPTMHGILEINLWGDGVRAAEDGRASHYRLTHFRLYDRSGYGMRLAGVSPHVKDLISSFASVRDLKMNKVIAIYDSEDLNPPKPTGRFLITADGYIRRSTTEGGPFEMEDAAEVAQRLSPSLLR